MAGRLFPTSTTFPGVKSGTEWTDEAASVVDPLWRYCTVPLTVDAATTANSLVLLSPSSFEIASYQSGQNWFVTATITNTAAMVATIDGKPIRNLRNKSGGALAGGDWVLGRTYHLFDTGSELRIIAEGQTTVRVIDQQTFTTSGTWSKPSGTDADAMAFIQIWGAGASGTGWSALCVGGGGGGYTERWVRLADLASSVSVTVGAGGVGPGSGTTGQNGGDSSFGSTVAKGGLSGTGGAGGTGGVGGAGQNNLVAVANVTSGGAGGTNAASGGGSIWGGGGGGNFQSPYRGGGASVHGGGGGGGSDTGTSGTGGASMSGGAGGTGGTAGSAGSAPGGGGGAGFGSAKGYDGARGEVRVTIIG